MRATAYPHPNRAPESRPLQLSDPESTRKPQGYRKARVQRPDAPVPIPAKVPPVPDGRKNAHRDPWKIRGVDECKRATLTRMAVEYEDICGHSRHVRVVWARWLWAYMLRRHTVASWPDIALLYRRSSHSAVIEGAQDIDRRLLLATGERDRRVETLDGPVDIQTMLDELDTEIRALLLKSPSGKEV